MGNNTISEIKGLGKIHIKKHDRYIVILTNVKSMPTVRRNLISYGCFEKAGSYYVGGSHKI